MALADLGAVTACLHWLLPPAPRRPRPMRPVSPADGYDDATLGRRCAEGALAWVAGQVYLPVDVAGTPQARREALALLVLGERRLPWVRPRGAGAVRALPPPGGPEEDPGRPRIELLVRTGCCPRSLPPLVRTRQCDVAADQVQLLGPLRVTTGPRTAVNLARSGGEPGRVPPPQESVVIAVTGDYFDIFERQGFVPEPDSDTRDGQWRYLEFSPQDGSDVLVVDYDTYIQPAAQRGRSAAVRLIVEDAERARVTFTTALLP